MLEYKPIWPETAVFWGAGATAAIGVRTTPTIGVSIYRLVIPGVSLRERVKQAIQYDNSTWINAVKDLLIILGDPEDSEDVSNCMRRQYPNLSDVERQTRLKQLRDSYDWGNLYNIIRICPGQSEEDFELSDLFNILDMHIQNNQGFYAYNHAGDEPFIPSGKLIQVRNTLKMLTVLLHTLDFQNAILNNRSILNQYESFVEVLYKLMVDEAHDLYPGMNKKLTQREFYLFSYSIISMNWDPILLWLLFNVHKKNNDLKRTHIGIPPMPLKLFHDMGGHFMGVRQIDGQTPQVWYPFNETVVQRINDPEHVTGRRVRVGKFYFPHGCSGWRECPNCGKLTMYMGSDWGLNTASLFPPLPLPVFQFGFQARSAEEFRAQNMGKIDAIQCSFCGTLTETFDAPLIMQSNFKGFHPSFIEEVQRDMRVSLEGTKHVVLMGYSLPLDDVIYRSVLSARKNRGESKLFCSIVGKSSILTNGWIYGTGIEQYMKRIKEEEPESSLIKTIKSAQELFGIENIRVCSDGIPNVFLNGEKASVDKVKDLLYPTNVFQGNRVERKSM
ncbi:hypothetical protein [Desulfuribacillus alkaliarsenatis]|nr:hypothetical protein [Desulfuribacillus alkaliarsenatis]